MADIQQPETRKRNRKYKRRSKKLSTKVDFTAMVDLGFLLITFFVFTTSLSAPTEMKLVLPDDTKGFDSTNIPENKTLSLVLGNNDRIYYYSGNDITDIQATNYSPMGMRRIILNKKADIKKMFGTDTGTIVVIKPTTESTYKNIVDAIDEMTIDNVKTFFFVEADKKETAAIASFK